MGCTADAGAVRTPAGCQRACAGLAVAKWERPAHARRVPVHRARTHGSAPTSPVAEGSAVRPTCKRGCTGFFEHRTVSGGAATPERPACEGGLLPAVRAARWSGRPFRPESVDDGAGDQQGGHGTPSPARCRRLTGRRQPAGRPRTRAEASARDRTSRTGAAVRPAAAPPRARRTVSQRGRRRGRGRDRRAPLEGRSCPVTSGLVSRATAATRCSSREWWWLGRARLRAAPPSPGVRP